MGNVGFLASTRQLLFRFVKAVSQALLVLFVLFPLIVVLLIMGGVSFVTDRLKHRLTHRGGPVDRSNMLFDYATSRAFDLRRKTFRVKK